MQTPYAFVKSFAGVIGNHGRGGDDGSPDYLCGNEIHFDANEKPLWLNGGLYRNKHAKNGFEYLNFTYYALGNDWELKPGCLKSKDNIHVLDPQQKSYALASIELDKKTIADQQLLEKGEWKFKDTWYNTFNKGHLCVIYVEKRPAAHLFALFSFIMDELLLRYLAGQWTDSNVIKWAKSIAILTGVK